MFRIDVLYYARRRSVPHLGIGQQLVLIPPTLVVLSICVSSLVIFALYCLRALTILL